MNQKNNKGQTALYYAIYWSHPDIVKYLLTNGARLKKNGNDSAVKVALKRYEELETNKLKTMSYLKSMRILEYLRSYPLVL